jgi:hypothetical protein
MILYDELAPYWPLFSAPAEYDEEAREAVRTLRAVTTPIADLLELGAGGGNNASHMKREFSLTLVEPSAGMRAHSQALNPECTHLPGDMRTVRLGRTFDAVFLHDAVMYMTSETDLRAALETVAVHLRKGGAALVTPDYTAETFAPGEEVGGHDDANGDSGVRWLEWRLSRRGTIYEVHYSVLVRDGGTVRAFHDVHAEGVFPRATWLDLFDDVGLDARLDARVIDGATYDQFVAKKR